MISVSKIFYALQTQGIKNGTPSLFIHMARCNLRCEGYNHSYLTPKGEKKVGCRHFDSVDDAFSEEWIKTLSYREIISEAFDHVADLSLHIKPDIVLTGGEPFLYWNEDEFQHLLEYFYLHNLSVTIETNATLPITFLEEYQKSPLFGITIPLSRSGEIKKSRFNRESVNEICAKASQSYFTFSFDPHRADEEIEEIISLLKEVETKKPLVFLMPWGENETVRKQNAPLVKKIALSYGFHFCESRE